MISVLERQDFTYDEDGNYAGPRGDQYLISVDGYIYKCFICHGCQSCWDVSPDGERTIENGPHFLSMERYIK